jgi:hypothetical protein
MSFRYFALVVSAMALIACDASPCTGDTAIARQTPASGADSASAESEDPIDPQTGLEASCLFEKIMAHPDPSVLLKEHVRLDSEGKLRTTDTWIDGAVDCPGHLGGPDTYRMIASYEIGEVLVRDSVATAAVTFQRLASVASDTFAVDTTRRVETVTMIKTRFGWRIRHQTMPWLNILRAHADGLSPADSARADSLVAAFPRGA